ncbi:MAG: DMT family transporter [Maricaulaceae bacterium]
MSQTRFIITAITLILIWGSAFTMVDVAVRSVSPIWVVAGRVSIAAIIIVTYAYMKGFRLPSLNDVRWRWYSVLGMTGIVIPFFLIGLGQQTIESGISAILIGAMPLMTIILAHFLTDERMTVMKLLGFIIGFSGLIVLFLPKDFSLSLVGDWKAQSFILLAAFFYGITTVFAKRAPETDSNIAAAMMLCAATIAAIVWALFEGLPQTAPDPIAYWMIFLLAVGSTGFATILYLNMIDIKGPTIMASVNYFVPVASVIFGIWFLGESFTLQKLIAFFVIIIGVLISRIGSKKPVTTT